MYQQHREQTLEYGYIAFSESEESDVDMANGI